MLALSLLSAWFSMHSFYVGITKIDRTAEGETHMTLQLFSDDLALALYQQPGRDQQLAQVSPANDTLIKRYVAAHFSIQSSKAPMAYQYLGYEQEKDQTFIYLLCPRGSPAPVRVFNAMLMEQFERQIHIIQYSEASCRWSDYTRKEQPALVITCP
jgi:hypothetical protein